MSTRQQAVLAFLCLFAPILHVLALGPRVPEGTFFLIGQLDQLGSLRGDPSNVIYSYARSPVYRLMGWTIGHPLAFLVLGILAHASFNAVVFGLAHQGLRSAGAAVSRSLGFAVPLAVTFLVFPLSLPTRLSGHGLTLVPHDAYYTFSMRTPFWIAVGLGTLAWILQRRGLALWVLGASCWIHPSAGILAFGLATLAVLVGLAVPAEEGRGRMGHLALNWLGAALLGAAPTLARLVTLGPPGGSLGSAGEVGFAQWYSSVIKDEADDFSFLFQLLYRVEPFVVITALIALVLFATSRVFPADRRDTSFWIAAALPILFLVGAALELLFAVWLPTPLVAPLIGLTPGYRWLSFAFFPLVVLGVRLVHAGVLALERRFPAISEPRVAYAGVFVVVSTAWLGLLGIGIAEGRTRATLEVTAWALQAGRVEGLDAYMAATSKAGRPFFFTPPLFEVDEPPVTYPGERSLLRIRALDRTQPEARLDQGAMDAIREVDFLEVVGAVRRELPKGAGLVIPPYMRHFRDSLPDYRIFFQEHHDGNLMMGAPAFLGFFTERMQELLGVTYEELPSKTSRLNYTAMRQAYLAVETREALALAERHPEYRYWLTERGHSLDLVPIIEAGDLIVYELAPQARDE